jgi:hypothetical protein
MTSRDSAIGITTGYGLDGRVFGFRVPEGATIFSFPRFRDLSNGTGSLFPGVKQQWHETDHSPPTSAEVKIHGSLHPLPNTPSWRSA